MFRSALATRSYPPQKPLPLPARAITCTEGSRSARSTAADDSPGAVLDVVEVGELVADAAREGGHLAAGGVDLGEEGLDRFGRADHPAEHVEAVDVPRALPDRVERRLAVEARHSRQLHVAV